MASVQKCRSASGSEFWKATWREGAPGEQRRQRAKSFATKAEAKRHAAHVEATIEARGIGSPEKFTVQSFLAYWISALERAGEKSPTTLVSYRRGAEILCRFLGRTEITRLSVPMLERAYADMLQRGKRVRNRPGETAPLSPVSVRNVHRTVSAALSEAVRWRWLPGNVAKEARPPRLEAERVKIFSSDDVARQLRAAQSDPTLACMLAVLLATGCRRGELLGIGADSLGDDGTLTIHRNVVAGSDHQPIMKTPKTRAGARRIRLPADVAALLTAQRARIEAQALAWGPGYQRDPLLLFPAPDGSPMVPTMLTQKLAALKKRAGVTCDASPTHGWRHTSASAMLREWVPIAAVARRLGHSNPRVTLSIYAHSDESDDARAAEMLGGLLERSVNVATALPHEPRKRGKAGVTAISRHRPKSIEGQ